MYCRLTSVRGIAGIFSHSVDCLFSLVIVYFVEQRLFSVMRFHLSVAGLEASITRILFRISFPSPVN